MLISLAIATLEKAFSYAASHQITTHQRWRDLYDKPLLLRLERPAMSLYCVIHADAVTLRPADIHDTVAVSITTDYQALLALLQGRRPQHAITIQGQRKLAQLFHHYLKNFTPNIEGMLASVIGDGAAYAITVPLTQAAERIRKDFDHMHRSAGAYVVHECDLTPSKRALQKFYRDVDNLHNRIDYLAQQLHDLAQQRKHL
jgi:ubiquinone biosynthesis protein UbiJ